MKSLGLFAALLLTTVGCENAKSKLDDSSKPRAEAQAGGPLDDRVAKLEETYAKYAEALDALDQAYQQQKQQKGTAGKPRHRPGDPDPDAVFGVDISQDLAAGQSEGPSDALVTIVEAWDFG